MWHSSLACYMMVMVGKILSRQKIKILMHFHSYTIMKISTIATALSRPRNLCEGAGYWNEQKSGRAKDRWSLQLTASTVICYHC